MVVILPADVQQEVSKLPEYAMGYQIALVQFSYQYLEGYILNGKLFVSYDEIPNEAVSVKEQVLERLKKLNLTLEWALGGSIRPEVPVKDFKLIPRPLNSLRGARRIRIAGAKQTFSAQTELAARAATEAAIDAAISMTFDAEILKRFSPYKDDFRVTAGRGLTPGTFATTEEDAQNVKTGMDAVERYALPGKQSANQVFTINPPTATRVQRGVVQPAYDQPGGGVEVILVDGSPDGTVYGPEEIPVS